MSYDRACAFLGVYVVRIGDYKYSTMHLKSYCHSLPSTHMEPIAVVIWKDRKHDRGTLKFRTRPREGANFRRPPLNFSGDIGGIGER